MASWLNRLGRSTRYTFKKGKDQLISSSLAGFIINHTRLQRYGKLMQLQLNSFEQQLSFTVLLAGEDAPIEVLIAYQTLEDTSAIVVTATDISREWLQQLARAYLLNKTLAVPKELHRILS